MAEPSAFREEAVLAIQRPHANLLKYYVLSGLLSGPLAPFVLPYRYFRYHTMRYRFDAEGIAMAWGILFRREISLTYARIQDIHLSSNLMERWLGLARIQIQTASGSSRAEMTLEGLREFEAVRDFLYSKMRGAKLHGAAAPGGAGEPAGHAAAGPELAAVLSEVAAELRAVREALASRGGA